jgi:hypothetical protein
MWWRMIAVKALIDVVMHIEYFEKYDKLIV